MKSKQQLAIGRGLPRLPSPLNPQPSTKPRYSIRKGFGVWHLVFDGKEAILKHERGIFYVAYLLTHPPEQPIHALDLMAKIPEIYRQQLGLAEMVDPATGKMVTMASHARLQERSLALDDVKALRNLLKKPNPIPIARWITIGTLNPEEWTVVFEGRWRQRNGTITADGSGAGAQVLFATIAGAPVLTASDFSVI